MWARYKHHSSFVLGFHGCDRDVGEAVLAGTCTLLLSSNDYDWLGDGIYFWEGSPARALEFAEQSQAEPRITKGKVSEPFALGAIIDLGHCCNLLDADSLDELARAHLELVEMFSGAQQALPENIGGPDRRMRRLDMATISLMHTLREETDLRKYQSVRAAFFEGGALYDGAGFSKRGHVQIAVRDMECIKGYFRPIPD